MLWICVFSVPNLGDSVDSEGGDTPSQWDAGPRRLGGSIGSDITPTNDGGGLGGGGESAVDGTKALLPSFTILLRTLQECSPYLCPTGQVRVMMATISLSRKNPLPLVQRDYQAKSRVIASTTRTSYLDGYTSEDVGWQFTFVSRRPCCCVLPPPSPRTKGWTRPIAQTRLSGLASWVALYWLRHCFGRERSRVSARTRALPAQQGPCLLAR